MDIKKLQHLVVDALEDVKAQDIRIFNTVGMTDLFDNVIIASGTSNRQTRALAASVRDKVKSAGGNVIGMEGDDTGEWVLVDLGDIVVHIMQPGIRSYYNLEELWGAKPLALKSISEAKAAKDGAAGKAPAKKAAAKKAPAKKAPAKKAAASKTAAPARKAGDGAPVRKAAPARKTAARKSPTKSA